MIDDETKARYASWYTETIRYADTDRQGHVNNAVFSTLLESGRVSIIYSRERPLLEPGTAFVIARLVLDFKAELSWPGTAQIGTRVERIGTSSVTLRQAIFQGATCVAEAETVIVVMDEATRRARPLGDPGRARLAELQVPAAAALPAR